MAIYKIKKDGNWSIVDNRILSNPEISAKAKVVLFYLLSRPNDWQVYEDDIINHMKEGRCAVQAALTELRGFGYIVRQQRFKDNGQFDGYDYDVYEIPQGQKLKSVPKSKKQKTDDAIDLVAELDKEEHRQEFYEGSPPQISDEEIRKMIS